MTEEQHSETSFEALQAEIAELKWKLDWNNAILTVLLQQEGGAVELSKELLASIPIAKGIYIKDQGETILIEGEFDDTEPTG